MAGFSTTTGGLNFQYPNRDTQNWDPVMANTFTTISSHDHDRDTAGRGAVLNDRSILLDNAGWLQASNLAGTGLVNLIRATTADTIELGGAFASLDITGALTAGTLSVSGLATLSAAATIGTTLTVSGLTTMSAAATVGTTLGVTGLTSLSTLNTSGLAAFAGPATVGTTLGVTGLATIGGTLGVSGITTLSAATTIEDDLTVTGTTILGPLTHPAADGTVNQVLKTDAAGNLGFANPGKVLQRVQVASSTKTSTTAQIPLDNTIPQNTEGTELLTLAITPKSTTSVLTIHAYVDYITLSTATIATFALFVDSVADALAATVTTAVAVAGNAASGSSVQFSEVAGSLTTRTYKLRYGSPNGTTTVRTLQSGSSTQFLGGTETIRIEIIETEV